MANYAESATSVGVVGAGVMGEALIAALIRFGISPTEILFAEKRQVRAEELVARYAITHTTLASVVCASSVILLVVKPQDMQAVLNEIKAHLNPKTLVISFAAGKKIDYISSHLGTANPIIRVMPNTATLVGQGAAAVSLGIGVSSEQREFTLGFLNSAGKAIEVGEDLQDAVTATSGSGPAYFFAFVEAMVEGATALGLTHEDATALTVQTIVGAAILLNESGDSATTLREKVTSPNGTTAAALASFRKSNLDQIVATAMTAARDRSQELA